MVTKKKVASEDTLLALARDGKVDAIVEVCDLDTASDNDRLVYKWLCAASDFGHAEKANAAIDDIMEWSSLRYDDDQYETSSAHWELAAAYLEGTDGLPRDLTLAKQHLEQAFVLHDLDGLSNGTARKYDAKLILARLTGEPKALLEDILARAPLGGGDDDE